MKRRGFLTLISGAAILPKPMGAAAKFGLATGYSIPAEDRAHQRTFMQWPNSPAVYRDSYFLRMTQKTIADIANTIAQFEPVVILADKAAHKRIGKRVTAGVELWDIPTEDLWCRDAGPLFARHPSKGLAVSNLNFNGWGGKQVHRHDAKIAARVARRLGLPQFDSGLHGEAGGVEQNGYGSLIAHQSSWLNPNRNPLSKAAVERRLLAAFGADQMIWAKGLRGHDITDYHIDSLARFVSENHILMQLPDAASMADPWVKSAYDSYEVLKKSTDAKGNAYKITVIPEPVSPRIKSYDFVAAYVNYYVCNGAVIAAEFGDTETDRHAKDTLQSLYPDREVVTLNVDPLGELGGGIHCATQQQPLYL